MTWRTLPLALLLAASLASCATTAQTPDTAAATRSNLVGDAARPSANGQWVRSELYFGVGSETTRSVDEAQWRAFLDREVTQRFPDGLTVYDGYGQWLRRGAASPERLQTKVLVILHEDTQARRDDIDAIRLAYKKATGDQSVLWSQQPATVSF